MAELSELNPRGGVALDRVAAGAPPGGRRRLVGEFRARGVIGGAIIVAFAFLALFGQALAPSSPFGYSTDTVAPPSAAHLLGTTSIGADVLSQVMAGARVSVIVGIAAAAISSIIGTFFGVIGGYFGGAIGQILGSIEDLFLVLPALPLVIVVTRVLGSSLTLIVVLIGVTSWAGSGRIIRSQVVTLRELGYIERARAMGASAPSIIVRHIVPNVAPLIVAETILVVAIAILTEAGLSFLGLGPSGTISWGSMLAQAVNEGAPAAGQWWWFIPPGLCIVLLVLAVALLGAELQHRTDYRLRRGDEGAR